MVPSEQNFIRQATYICACGEPIFVPAGCYVITLPAHKFCVNLGIWDFPAAAPFLAAADLVIHSLIILSILFVVTII